MPDQRIFELTEQPSLDNDAWLIMDKSGWQTARRIAPGLVAGGGGSTLPVADTQTIVKGSVDDTKLLRFEVDGFTAGATRVLTPPNANATIAGLEVANVFTQPQAIDVATSGANAPYVDLQDGAASKARFELGRTSSLTMSNTNRNDLLIYVPGANQIFFGTSSTRRIWFGANGNLFQEVTTALTNNFTTAMQFAHISTGTPTTGFGTAFEFRAESSTTVDRQQGQLRFLWADGTDATRAARGILTAYYTTTQRECIRWQANSTDPMVGFMGAAAIARPSSYTLAGTAGRTLPTPPGAFTGIDNAQAGTVYAQVADLNTLRTTVSDLVGVVRQLIVDLASTSGFGLLQAA